MARWRSLCPRLRRRRRWNGVRGNVEQGTLLLGPRDLLLTTSRPKHDLKIINTLFDAPLAELVIELNNELRWQLIFYYSLRWSVVPIIFHIGTSLAVLYSAAEKGMALRRRRSVLIHHNRCNVYPGRNVDTAHYQGAHPKCWMFMHSTA